MNQSNPPEAPSENLLSRRALIERAELGDLGLALPEAATAAASAESAASRMKGAADSGAALVPLNRFPAWCRSISSSGYGRWSGARGRKTPGGAELKIRR